MTINQNYLSRQTTEHLKGFLAIAVLLHHIYQKTSIIPHDSLCGFFCQSVGYYCVSMFFFISGYGLLCSYKRNNGGGYLANYQWNRVLPIFAINAVLVLIYLTQKFILGFDISLIDTLLSFVYGGSIVSNGWYLLCIMVFYELFYFSAKLRPEKVSLTLLAFTLVYIIITVFTMPTWYVVSSLAFPCGALFCENKDHIDNLLKQYYVPISIATLILYILCFSLLFLISNGGIAIIPGIGGIQLVLSLVHGVLFCGVLILAVVWKGDHLQTETPFKRNLSQIYLELYVTQGLSFNFLRNPLWSVENDWFFLFCSIVMTFIFAVSIHPLFQLIIKSIKKQNI